MSVYKVPRFFRPNLSGNPVFLLGHSRSGTSWVADCLFRNKSIQYFYEPSNPGSGLGGSWNFWNRYPNDNNENEDINCVYDPIVKGQRICVPGRRYFLGRILMNKIYTRQIAIKDVGLCLGGEYFKKRYNASVIILVRHPMAVTLSCLRQGDSLAEKWIKILESQTKVKEIAENIITRKGEFYSDPFKFMLAVVGIKYKVIQQQLKRNHDWVVIKYETFCQNPERGTIKVLNVLNLKPAEDLERWFLETTKNTDGKMYGRKRDTASMPEKWKQGLSTTQLMELYNYYMTLGVGMYEDPNCWLN